MIDTENDYSLHAWFTARDNSLIAGLVDRFRHWKPRGHWLADEPMIELSHRTRSRREAEFVTGWTPYKASAQPVQAYSKVNEVELFLDGRSRDTKRKPFDDSPRSGNFPFAHGVLRAVGRYKGQALASKEMRTAGATARIELATSKPTLAATCDDAAFVTVRVVDTQGVVVSSSSQAIMFWGDGKTSLAAVDTGSVTSHQPYHRTSAHGQCMVIDKAAAVSTNMTVTAKAESLGHGASTIDTVSARGEQ